MVLMLLILQKMKNKKCKKCTYTHARARTHASKHTLMNSSSKSEVGYCKLFYVSDDFKTGLFIYVFIFPRFSFLLIVYTL